MRTLLDATNDVLAAMNLQPVSGLDDGDPDASKIANAIAKTVRRICMAGWEYANIFHRVSLARDVEGKVRISDDVLRLVPDGSHRWRRLLVRKDGTDKLLYDADKDTFVFSSSPTARVTYLLAFENLPEELQELAVQEAVMETLVPREGMSEGARFSAQRLNEARGGAMQAEAECVSLNAIKSNGIGAWMTMDYSILNGS